MFNAARINSARRCVSIAQPTMRREYTSSTIAKYKNPDHVGTYVISAVGSRYYVRADVVGVFVLGDGAGCVFAPHCGLGDGDASARRVDSGGVEHGDHAAPAASRDPS